jgi:hypothetical protein
LKRSSNWSGVNWECSLSGLAGLTNDGRLVNWEPVPLAAARLPTADGACDGAGDLFGD